MLALSGSEVGDSMVQTPGTVPAAAAVRLRLSGRGPTAAATLDETGISDTTLLLAINEKRRDSDTNSICICLLDHTGDGAIVSLQFWKQHWEVSEGFSQRLQDPCC